MKHLEIGSCEHLKQLLVWNRWEELLGGTFCPKKVNVETFQRRRIDGWNIQLKFSKTSCSQSSAVMKKAPPDLARFLDMLSLEIRIYALGIFVGITWRSSWWIGLEWFCRATLITGLGAKECFFSKICGTRLPCEKRWDEYFQVRTPWLTRRNAQLGISPSQGFFITILSCLEVRVWPIYSLSFRRPNISSVKVGCGEKYCNLEFNTFTKF